MGVEYGENIIPEDAAPRGTLSGDDGRQVAGGLVITTDPNQPAPDYGDGDECPAVSEVRLLSHAAHDGRLRRPATVHQPPPGYLQRAGGADGAAGDGLARGA